MTPLYPLRFKEILRDYRFGERWIAEVFEKDGLPPEGRIAETWEVCDRPNESSVVTNGPLAGATLHELIAGYGADLLGTEVTRVHGSRFPLLIKLLDVTHPLGEQVHQSDALARARGLADPGKTEAWYMLRVKPGATVRCGSQADVDREQVRAALLNGSIRQLMAEHAVQPGDAFLLHAGTMHFSGGGALFYEIMQNSDVIIGLRSPALDLPEAQRAAQVELMLEGIHLEEGFDPQVRPAVLAEGANRRTFILAGEHFALERLDLATPYPLDCTGARFFVLTQIEGFTRVQADAGSTELRPGQSCLLPAVLGRVLLTPQRSSALLKAYLPDLVGDIIQPLRCAGIPDVVIAGLGGQTRLNPLPGLLHST